ncbi:hypothetical protein OSB04_008228 [Centaurea solstitialis]|uniref:Uncharacterized protein n=1 Tax=Centaurea solstitialis TaxID=347529 RepID=A0AA38TLD7_9ASTR|nr:hypothetical protein OSB04_008228 [Centaurea solstitialis]
MDEDDNNSNCFFDFSLIEQIPVPGGELPSLESDFHWSSNPFPAPSPCPSNISISHISAHWLSSNLVEDQFLLAQTTSHASVYCSSAGFLDSAGKPDCSKEQGSRKRFQELNEILDPGRPPKMDKTVILGDAIRRVTQLRDETMKLKESAQDLQAKINELKAEKNELRDEKQKLKVEKERLEQQVKAFSRPPPAAAAFYPPPPHSAMPIPFPASPMVDSKFLPVMGYHGVPMWPFAPATAVDTSEDHVHRSPLA